MKNKILFSLISLIFCTSTLQLHAQLIVDSIGNVTANKKLKVNHNIAIGTNNSSNIGLNILRTGSSGSTAVYGIKSHAKMTTAMPTSPLYGVYGFADALSCSAMASGYPMAGVYGYAAKIIYESASTVFSAGVAGITHSYGGIGVYGGIRSSLPSSMTAYAKYAGYFDGTVNVNGTLVTPATAILSGESIMADTPRSLSESLSNKLNALQPVSYTLKQDTAWQYDTEAKELQGIHYGLNLQEVQKLFPELVYERGDNKYINYVELIPILIKSIQELSAEVEELKKSNR